MIQRQSARARIWQWVFVLALALAAWGFYAHVVQSLALRRMNFSFAFLTDHANFDIPFHLVGWRVGDTYARALLVCTLNTLLVSAAGIVAATLLGLLVGVMRLSANWLVRKIALVYIELVRNTPQLVQIAFWYIGVLHAMPPLRQSIALPGGALLNIRGLYLPRIDAEAWTIPLGLLTLAAMASTPLLWRLCWRGKPLRAMALVPPCLALVAFGASLGKIEYPVLRGFNIAGGIEIPPEFVALWAGLSIYSSAFIAEIVRGAILSVQKGQREAALTLGLKPAQIMRKVILPQAMRVMVPPLTSQYLNLVKSSSLGAAIAYPELFSIFAGTVLNQTGRELETILILMAIFLAISLGTSAFMNWYNQRVALVMR